MEVNFHQQLEFLQALNKLIDERAELATKNSPSDPYESESTNEIATALAKAQGEFPRVNVNQENPYFKSGFADLNNIVRTTRPALAKNNLSLTQQTKITPDGATILVTRLRHSSGQWIDSRVRIIPPKNDMQSYASTLSYMKRHSIMALLCITIDADFADDDAELAMVTQRETFAKGTAINRKYDPREQSNEVISTDLLNELEHELAQYPDITEQVLDGLHIQSLADMPKSKYEVSIRRVREIKNARNGLTAK
jgi:hypothetical protein